MGVSRQAFFFNIFSNFKQCVMVYIGLLVVIGLATFVYNDSKGRGMNQMLWAVLTLLFGIVTLIIYLIVRKPKGFDDGGDADILDDGMF